MSGRTYKDRNMQLAYDGTVENFRSGLRGWKTLERGWKMRGLFNEDGTRFRLAGMHAAFWLGYEGFTLNNSVRGGIRLMYIPGTISRAAYMAGRDCAKTDGSDRDL